MGSDWPHAEGIERPLADYDRAIDGLAEPSRAKLLGGNAQWLLGNDDQPAQPVS